jgi:hypothetical protein
MCCIGIYLKACGTPDSLLCNIRTATKNNGNVPKQATWLLNSTGHGSKTALLLYGVNDSTRVLDEKQRESKISCLFAKHKVKVKFINGKPPRKRPTTRSQKPARRKKEK